MTLRRREFITLLGGAAAWPLAAHAQQRERMRRIGALVPGDENDPVRKTYVSTFAQALCDLGWTDGRNVRMDVRWAGDTSIGYERSRTSWSVCGGLCPICLWKRGGLLYYGHDQIDTFRRAASYADLILRGAKPGDLPAQFPINLTWL
jgi:hypothetical protein